MPAVLERVIDEVRATEVSTVTETTAIAPGIPEAHQALLMISNLKVFHQADCQVCQRGGCRGPAGPIQRMFRIASDYSQALNLVSVHIETKEGYDKQWMEQLAKLAKCPCHTRFEQYQQDMAQRHSVTP